MLSDNVLRCSGVMGWFRGNPLLVWNKGISQNRITMAYKSLGNALAAEYECIYKRGHWERACGEAVNVAIGQIKNQFIHFIKTYTRHADGAAEITVGTLCDRCNEESNLKVFKHFDHIIGSMLKDLLFDNQSPDLYKECHLVDYPLNKCHTQNFWRRDLFNIFCHNVTLLLAPQLKPHLPLCDLDEWIESARLWGYKYVNKVGTTYQAVYPRIKQCSKLVYDHLSNTCRHGPPVVRLIQDLRTVLMFNQHQIASNGMSWLIAHQFMMNNEQHVGQC